MFWILTVYAAVVLITGIYFYTRTPSPDEYLLGGRKTGAGAATVSSQISLIGLLFTVTIPLMTAEPGGGLVLSIMSAAGIVTGLFLQSILVSGKIRVYSELSGNVKTVPEYLENRFEDKTGVLRALSASLIFILGILLISSILNISADILGTFFAQDNSAMLIASAVLVSVYVALGGLSSIVLVDSLRGILLFVYLVFILVSGFDTALFERAPDIETDFLSNAVSSLSGNAVPRGIIFFVSYAFLPFGMTSGNICFMSTRERKSPLRRSVSVLIWLIPAAAGGVLSGSIAVQLARGETLKTAGEFVSTLAGSASTILGTLIVAIIIASVLSVADSAAFSAGSALAHDLLCKNPKKTKKKREQLTITRLCPVLAVFIALAYATFSGGEAKLSVCFILSLISSALGPVLLFGLYCRFITVKGAVLSIITGVSAAITVKYVFGLTGTAEIIGMIPAFAVATLTLFAVSALDRKKPSAKVLNEFGRTSEIVKMK